MFLSRVWIADCVLDERPKIETNGCIYITKFRGNIGDICCKTHPNNWGIIYNISNRSDDNSFSDFIPQLCSARIEFSIQLPGRTRLSDHGDEHIINTICVGDPCFVWTLSSECVWLVFIYVKANCPNNTHVRYLSPNEVQFCPRYRNLLNCHERGGGRENTFNRARTSCEKSNTSRINN